MTERTQDFDNAVAGLADRVHQALDSGNPLRIAGGSTKDFYGGPLTGDVIRTTDLTGIISYDPTELVVHVAAGTPLRDLQQALGDAGQMLPFEPPAFGPDATVGGVVAAGISGPRRPYGGSVRDHVLGVGLINGKAEHIAFGGQVMKNVAGYDVSRVVAGSLGVLGIITDASFKVLPKPLDEITLEFTGIDRQAAIDMMSGWARTPAPVSATAHYDDTLRVRVSGAGIAVQASARQLGGTPVTDDGSAFWDQVRELKLPGFDGALWRISVPPAAADIALDGAWLVEWGGAQRWLAGATADAATIRAAAEKAGGHATAFRGTADRANVFAALDPVVARLHGNLKAAFDPRGVFNPGRLYAEF